MPPCRREVFSRVIWWREDTGTNNRSNRVGYEHSLVYYSTLLFAAEGSDTIAGKISVQPGLCYLEDLLFISHVWQIYLNTSLESESLPDIRVTLNTLSLMIEIERSAGSICYRCTQRNRILHIFNSLRCISMNAFCNQSMFILHEGWFRIS